jgi:hypothetical protein
MKNSEINSLKENLKVLLKKVIFSLIHENQTFN